MAGPGPGHYAGRPAERPSRLAVGDRAAARARDELDVLGHQSTGVARRRALPRSSPTRELRFRHVELDEPLAGVDADRVAFVDESDVAALVGLGSDVPDDHAPG